MIAPSKVECLAITFTAELWVLTNFFYCKMIVTLNKIKGQWHLADEVLKNQAGKTKFLPDRHV